MAYETIFWHGYRVKQLRTVLGLTIREFAYYVQMPESIIRDHEKNKYARGWWSIVENRMNEVFTKPNALLTKRFFDYRGHLIANVRIIDKTRFNEENTFCNEIREHITRKNYEKH